MIFFVLLFLSLVEEDVEIETAQPEQSQAQEQEPEGEPQQPTKNGEPGETVGYISST